jgi:hypothetical protein
LCHSDEVFEFKYLLDKHLIADHDDSPFVCTYRDCGKRFKLQKYLSVHLNRHASADRFQGEHVDEIGAMEYTHPNADNSLDSAEMNGSIDHRGSEPQRYHKAIAF